MRITRPGHEMPMHIITKNLCFVLLLVTMGLHASYVSAADTDSDGVDDALDNCTAVANPGQEDADGDGHGNILRC